MTGYQPLSQKAFPTMPDDDEIVMYVIVRTDLNMSPGKQGAQIGHAVHLSLWGSLDNTQYSNWTETWHKGSYPKVLLRAGSENELRKIHAKLMAADIFAVLVVDEGR